MMIPIKRIRTTTLAITKGWVTSNRKGEPCGILIGDLDAIKLGTPTGNVLSRLKRLNCDANTVSESFKLAKTAPVSGVEKGKVDIREK